jgi:hypothetical protein
VSYTALNNERILRATQILQIKHMRDLRNALAVLGSCVVPVDGEPRGCSSIQGTFERVCDEATDVGEKLGEKGRKECVNEYQRPKRSSIV